jgi:hypothetical protein
MINFVNPRRFFLAQYAVDFRKGHQGLLSEARRNGIDPYCGDMVAFVSRDRKKIKAIVGDDTGLTIIYKSFSTGSIKTKLRFLESPEVRDITFAEIAMLLEGSAYTLHKLSKKWLPKTCANILL